MPVCNKEAQGTQTNIEITQKQIDLQSNFIIPMFYHPLLLLIDFLNYNLAT